jgi:hypothetical protein
MHKESKLVKIQRVHSPSTLPLLRVLREILSADLLLHPAPSVITCTSDSSEDEPPDDLLVSSSLSSSSMKSRSEPSESESIKRCQTMTHKEEIFNYYKSSLFQHSNNKISAPLNTSSMPNKISV